MSEAFELAFDEAMARTAGAKTNEDGKKYVQIPDGEHTFILKSVDLQENDGKSPALVPTFYFPQQNQTEKMFINLVEQAAPAVAGFFKGLGIVPRSGNKAELLRAAKTAEGWTLKGKKQTKEYTKKDGTTGTDRRYYINSVVDRGATRPPVATDDIVSF